MQQQGKRNLVLLVCFMIGFGLGMLIMNLVDDSIRTQYGGLYIFQLKQLLECSYNPKELLEFLLFKRGTWLIIVFLLAFLCRQYALVVHGSYVLVQGISMGSMLVIALFAYGVKGLMLAVLSLLPHYIFYIIGYVMAIQTQLLFSYKKTMTLGIGLRIIVSFLLILCGLLLESYVNPILLQKF